MVSLADGEALVKIVSKILPAGTWAVFGIANMSAVNSTFAPHHTTFGDAYCELRQGNFYIGGAASRELLDEDDNNGKRSLSLFGGALASAGDPPALPGWQ